MPVCQYRDCGRSGAVWSVAKAATSASSSGIARAAPSAACALPGRRTLAGCCALSLVRVPPIDPLVLPADDRPSAFDQRSESTLRPSPSSGGVLLTCPLHIEHWRRGQK